MKCTRRVFIGALLMVILMVNMASPTLAWSYGGAYWHNGIAPIQKDSTIPSSWSSSLTAAANSWSNAGPEFQFSWMITNNKLHYGPLSPNSVIGQTYPYHPNGDSMVSCATTFNSNRPWSTTGAPGCFDVQTIAVHEFGHWLYLEHSSVTNAVMYPYISLGQVKRNLNSDDLTGLVYLYGSDKAIANDANKSITNKSINIPISSLLEAYTHEDLSNYSDSIVKGTVKEVLPSKWNTIEGRQPNKPVNELNPGEDVIYTDIIISVDKYLKNPSSSKEVIVRVVGGTVGNVSMTSDAEPSFKSGEKVLIYLAKDTSPSPIANVGQEHFRVTGLMQGKFTLTDNGKAIGWNENVSKEELLSTFKSERNSRR